MNDLDRVISYLSPSVINTIAALLFLFPDARPMWVQVRRVCEVSGSPERPVAAAFGYLPNMKGKDTDLYGYTDMLDGSQVSGFVDLRIGDFEINAAYEYFLWRYPESKKCEIRSRPTDPLGAHT